jgi:hypothetical protein
MYDRDNFWEEGYLSSPAEKTGDAQEELFPDKKTPANAENFIADKVRFR